MRLHWPIGLLSGCLLLAQVAAEPLTLGKDDSIASILAARQGERVTLKLASGVELTGKVGEVNDSVVHLMALTGMEFFDAVADLESIEAVVIRTRSR